jgi:hypothetical protein
MATSNYHKHNAELKKTVKKVLAIGVYSYKSSETRQNNKQNVGTYTHI